MLRFAEEIILILLDDEDGKFVRVPRWSLNYALAGGVLMDLAMENRIDTDIENLMLIDATPVGDSLLDPVLAEIAAEGQKDIRSWLELIAEKASDIREEALTRLVAERHPGTAGRPIHVDVQVSALSYDRRRGGARGEAAHHGGPVQ